MRPIIILLPALLASSLLFSQDYINGKKERCRKSLNKFVAKHNYSEFISETDSTLSLVVRDTGVRPLDIVLYFNEKGKCIKEVRKLDCDSCFKKWLDRSLGSKLNKWEKINDSTWVSRFFMKKILTIHPSIPYTYTIIKYHWTKEQYEEIISK